MAFPFSSEKMKLECTLTYMMVYRIIKKKMKVTIVRKQLQNVTEVSNMDKNESIHNSRELEFAVFCIENVAESLGVSPQEVYKMFKDKSDILYGYIVPEYEILHTQSKEYIVNDIIELMHERGVTL